PVREVVEEPLVADQPVAHRRLDLEEGGIGREQATRSVLPHGRQIDEGDIRAARVRDDEGVVVRAHEHAPRLRSDLDRRHEAVRRQVEHFDAVPRQVRQVQHLPTGVDDGVRDGAATRQCHAVADDAGDHALQPGRAFSDVAGGVGADHGGADVHTRCRSGRRAAAVLAPTFPAVSTANAWICSVKRRGIRTVPVSENGKSARRTWNVRSTCPVRGLANTSSMTSVSGASAVVSGSAIISTPTRRSPAVPWSSATSLTWMESSSSTRSGVVTVSPTRGASVSATCVFTTSISTGAAVLPSWPARLHARAEMARIPGFGPTTNEVSRLTLSGEARFFQTKMESCTPDSITFMLSMPLPRSTANACTTRVPPACTREPFAGLRISTRGPPTPMLTTLSATNPRLSSASTMICTLSDAVSGTGTRKRTIVVSRGRATAGGCGNSIVRSLKR